MMISFFSKRALSTSAIALLLLFSIIPAYGTDMTSKDEKAFLESFINHYECNPEGRYTHEYHPFLLDWTGKSLHRLENHLRNEKFTLDGRMIIMGYEENAVPQYYTWYKKPKINDEASRKNHGGWSLRLHNRFGFMTGFLFKDIDYLPKKGITDSLFHHIDAQTIPLFDSQATIFQEHAFGQARFLLWDRADLMMHRLVHKQDKLILQDLVDFWRILYNSAFMVGDKQIAGTQDVFFSIEYAQYLSRSILPLRAFFTGPDITYPIEITGKQDQDATISAQHFVHRFIKELTPIEEQNTVYVFCSFVDGVGKSTMLGNIKNWMLHGPDVQKYNHVDNSSSQLAELFQFKDKVFIADLPAQISHFTYKPDGFVYVDVRTQIGNDHAAEVEKYVREHWHELKEAYLSDIQTACHLVITDGWHSKKLNDPTNPAFAFLKNLLLLKRESSNYWIPFFYNEKAYLFKETEPFEVRIITPLSSVRSEGLKNIESEQMLFFEGIRFALPYEDFLSDLKNKLTTSNIKHIVFVDFLSMYPRSSRENIRINYLLQQMALLDEQCNPSISMYHEFVSGGELLYYLLNKEKRGSIISFLQLEASLRLALFQLLISRSTGDITGIDVGSLSQQLSKNVHEIMQKHGSTIDTLISEKIKNETACLEKTYALSKSFMNIQQLSLSRVSALSFVLQQFFSQLVSGKTPTSAWQTFTLDFIKHDRLKEGEDLDIFVDDQRKEHLRILAALHPECKNELLLKPWLRALRSCWFLSVLNITGTPVNNQGRFEVKREHFPAWPLQFLPGPDGFFYVCQKAAPLFNMTLPADEIKRYKPFSFNEQKVKAFVSYNQLPYRADWRCEESWKGIFGFGYKPSTEISTQAKSFSLACIIEKYQKEHGADHVIPTSTILESLERDKEWLETYNDMQKEAQKDMQEEEARRKNKGYQDPQKNNKRTIKAVKPEQMASYGHLVRLLATIEMVLRDPESSIVIRDGNRQDFKAAIKLFEKVALPLSIGFMPCSGLFPDYNAVEPFPSWHFWEDVERGIVASDI